MLDVCIIGGGINGLCCAWQLARQGYRVYLHERDTLMGATSRASSKLLHGGLRYLENREFRLVREALRERDAWIGRVPYLAWPLQLIIPIYRTSRRPAWKVALGLFIYGQLAGKSVLPKFRRVSANELVREDPNLRNAGLIGGFEFWDGQMDDYALGIWVAEQARLAGATLNECSEVVTVTIDGSVTTKDGTTQKYDRVINVAGPWAQQLLEASGIESPYQLDLVRGCHLIFDYPCKQAYLLEVPFDRRIFFVLPWKGKTLVGTTEVRHFLKDPITCSQEEQKYLLDAWAYYFPMLKPAVIGSFAGVRPLVFSSSDPTSATREYAVYRKGHLLTVFGGKWTTAMALAKRVSDVIQ